MARVIEFYVPQNYKSKQRSIPIDGQRGKVILFTKVLAQKSA
jgi:predicted nucleotidyltransferase